MKPEEEETAVHTLKNLFGHAERQPCLVALTGRSVGCLFKLRAGGMVIGRAPDVDILLDDEGVSRVHAVVVDQGEGFAIRDMESTNGTFVGEDRVGPEPRALVEGDRIRIGSETVLRFGEQDSLEQQFLDKLYRSATRDSLTGLYNKRFFLEQIRQEIAWHRRHEAPLSLMFLDVDHFKRINDVHGHLKGDQILQQMGEVLRESTRTEDLVARFGGEEFTVVLRQTDAEPARRMAERIRKNVEAHRFDAGGTRLSLSVSVGVVTKVGRHLSTAEQLMADGDALMYMAKSRGRNRVVPAPGKP